MGDARDTAERRKGRTGRVRAEAGRDRAGRGETRRGLPKAAGEVRVGRVAGAQALMAISADPNLQIRDT